nr:receptor-like serine/threonine-protein kinase SD1-8 [Tanacetum cinerariifolium]
MAKNSYILDFTRNRRQIRNIDPPAGLFFNHITSSFHCVFVSLDTRIKSTKYTSDKSFTLGYTEAVVNVNILQFAMVCFCVPVRGQVAHFYYVYNPSTNLVKILSKTDYAHDDSKFYGCVRLRLAFDPTKLPDYKVVRAGRNSYPRINSRKYIIKKSFTFGSTEEADKVKILQSCNGLLLCIGSRRHAFDYVYNPSTNLLKILPEPDYANVDSNVYGCAGLRLAFDPTQLPYYKVVRAGRTCSDIFIQIYCLEKGNWSLWNDRFNYFFLHFDSAVYWNNTLHWLETENSQIMHYKLNIEYPNHPIIAIIQIPQSLQQGRNFFKSYGNILPMIITIQIPHILHLKGKLFDSRGCLLLVRRDDFGFSEFTIYDMMKGSFVWSVRYHVGTDDFMTPLPEGWSIRSTVWSIVLGEKEDDSFLVINLFGKVLEYNLISKNPREMYDMGSNQLTDDYHDGFIPPGCIPLLQSIDTITSTTPLTSNQTLVSNGDAFELGFFSISDSKNLYVGIWYKQIQERTYVWVANRDDPINSSSGKLTIGKNGNIILVDQSETAIWSSNQSVPVANVVAQLLNDGNFVLRHENDEKPENYIWQSFDHPTDTLLPKMKLGWSKETGNSKILRSWKSNNDPGSGDSSFKVDVEGFPELMIRHKDTKICRSGPWNGERFSGTRTMKGVRLTNFSFVENSEEIYYSYSMLDSSVYSRVVINSSGILQRYIWVEKAKYWNQYWFFPSDRCDNYGVCGPYGVCDANSAPNCKCMTGFGPKDQQAWALRDGSGGCIRTSSLDCGSDGFLPIKNVRLPDGSKAFIDQNMTLSQCREICKKNCSCTAYANMDITRGGSGCAYWAVDLMDIRQYAEAEGGQDLYIRVSASDLGVVNVTYVDQWSNVVYTLFLES